MNEELLARVPLLVYANKQDLDLAMDPDDVSNIKDNYLCICVSRKQIKTALELDNITERQWSIQACSAMSEGDDNGLSAGVTWLIETMNAKNQAAAAQ